MLKCKWICALAMAAALCGSAAAQTASELEKKVDAVFAGFVTPGSPGCALGVIRDGKLTYARGYGLANLEHNIPITPQTIFDIGSTSKQFSAASIVLLAQQGKLSIDDDVRKYIPELPDYGKTITIRHLLNHTSGLRDYLTLMSLTGTDFDGVTGDAEAMHLIVRQKELNFPPGSEYLYSNTGFFLLSQIVKRVTGKTLREFAKENIFTPLGMTATHYHDDHTMIVPLRATAYALRRPAQGAVPGFTQAMSFFEQTGDGAVYTSVEELARWDANFYEPKVGGRALWDTLTTRGVLNDGEKIEYALGLRIADFRGLPTISHGGSWAGYRAEFLRFPEQRFSVICLCNLASTNPSALAERVAEIYLEDKLKPRAAAPSGTPAAATVSEEVLKRYTGMYRSVSTGQIRRFVLDGGKLKSRGLAGPLIEMIPESETRFRPAVGAGVFVTFEAGQGKPKMMLSREGAKPEDFEFVEAFSPAPAQLAEFSGKYASDELETTYTISVEGDGLRIRGTMGEPRTAQPTYRDAFFSQGVQLEFQRDAAGRVTGFVVQAGRVRNIAFARVAPAK